MVWMVSDESVVAVWIVLAYFVFVFDLRSLLSFGCCRREKKERRRGEEKKREE